MMPNSIFYDDKIKSSLDPQNHKTAYLAFPEDDKIKVHEADGICYDGDIENFKWQIRILPDCSQYSEINKSFLINIVSGTSVNEIEPFIQSLNIGDILYAIVTMASYNETAKSIRYSNQGTITNLEGSLVAALQDRLLIIPKRKQNKVEIPYSEIKKIDQRSEVVAGGFRFNHITIELFDGNKINFHLSKAVSSSLHFLKRHERLVSWIRKNIGYSAASSADEPKLEYQWMAGTAGNEEEARYENLSIKDLKGILRKRGLPVRGKSSNVEEYKLELIARLKGKEESFSLEPWETGDRTFYDSKPIDEKDVPEIVNLQSKYKSKHTSGYFKSSKPQSSVYPLYLYLSLFLLFFMIFSVVYEIFESGIYDDKEKSYSENQVLVNRLFILTFVGLFVAVKWKTDDLQLNVRPYHTVVLTNVFTIIIVVSILVWFVALLDDPVYNTHSFFQILSSVGCCGSTIFLISIAAIFSSVPTQNNILVAEQERFIFESKSRRILFDTIKCENHGYLDRAKKLWMSAYFDEDKYPEEVERLEKFEVEIEYVRVKRRISNLKEKGVNCEKLENKLFQESLLKSFGIVESSDSDTINQEQ